MFLDSLSCFLAGQSKWNRHGEAAARNRSRDFINRAFQLALHRLEKNASPQVSRFDSRWICDPFNRDQRPRRWSICWRYLAEALPCLASFSYGCVFFLIVHKGLWTIMIENIYVHVHRLWFIKPINVEISLALRPRIANYIGKIWNQSENV